MERLTFPLPDGRMATHSKFNLYVEQEPIPDLPGACKTVQYYITGEIVDRLAAYEDTGMEPKDVKGLRKFCESNTETTMEHIYELAQAEKEGRVIILPAPAKHGDPKPECFYNDNAGLWCLGMAQTDGDEPAERCKMCWYCENGYAAEEEGRP